MIPWRRIKWAIVRYLVGTRVAIINAKIVGGTVMIDTDGAYVADCFFQATEKQAAAAGVAYDFGRVTLS